MSLFKNEWLKENFITGEPILYKPLYLIWYNEKKWQCLLDVTSCTKVFCVERNHCTINIKLKMTKIVCLNQLHIPLKHYLNKEHN